MKAPALALLIILVVGIATPALAANDERYSYITIENVAVRLDNSTAVIHVNYTVDEGTRFIFFLLGKQDLKNKLLKILNYEDAQMKRIDLSSADFTVNNAAFSYGNGVYWFPSHRFNVQIPSLTVETPQLTRIFADTNMFPAGMGYFGIESSVKPAQENRPANSK